MAVVFVVMRVLLVVVVVAAAAVAVVVFVVVAVQQESYLFHVARTTALRVPYQATQRHNSYHCSSSYHYFPESTQTMLLSSYRIPFGADPPYTFVLCQSLQAAVEKLPQAVA